MLVGVNPTLMVHVPGPNVVGQLLTGTNGALGKVMLIGIATVPLFVTVNICVALVCPIAIEPNACEVGDTVIGAVPVPVNEIVCVPAPSTTKMSPVSAPMLFGVKVIEMLQLLPFANGLVQVVVAVKFALLGVMLLIVSAAVPLFVSLTVAAPLLALTTTEPNACDVADSVAVWASASGAEKPRSKNETNRTTRDTTGSLLDFITASLASQIKPLNLAITRKNTTRSPVFICCLEFLRLTD